MPVPFELTDDFTDTNGAAWDPAIWTTRNVEGASATPAIHSNAGRMQTDPAATGDCRIMAYAAPTVADFDLTIRFTATDVESLGGFPEICYRVSGGLASGAPGPGYSLQLAPSGGTITLWRLPSYSEFVVVLHDQPINNTDAWYYRIRVKGPRHLIKWWLASGPEPPSWKIDATDATYASGKIFVGTYNNNAFDTITLDWDDLHLLEILPPDPGFRVASEPVVDIKIGAVDVVTAYMGGVELPVTWP